MELVSIIVPAFNAETYIRATLDSALRQTYANCEIIVVDDGSTDGTLAILADYGEKVRVVRQQNRGSACARNAGVAAAHGEWIAFLDSDDIWLPDKTVKQLAGCGRFPISHTDSVCFGETLERELLRSSFEPPYAGEVLDQLLVVNFITTSTVMVRRDIFERFGGFDESYVTCEDWALWLKICAEHELGYLAEPVVRYRFHKKSKSTMSRRTLIARLRILNEAFSPGGVGEARAQMRSPAMASALQVTSHFAAGGGDWRFAVSCAASALRYRPSDIRSWKTLVKAALIPLGVPY